MTFDSCTITGNTADNVRAHAQKFPLPHYRMYVRSATTLKVMGNDLSSSILIFDDGCCLDLPEWSTCNLSLKLQKFPSPRWDFHMFCALCLQGGGVYINGGTVSFSSCTINGNTAPYVRAHAQNFPSPRLGKALLTESSFAICLGSNLVLPALPCKMPPWEIPC